MTTPNPTIFFKATAAFILAHLLEGQVRDLPVFQSSSETMYYLSVISSFTIAFFCWEVIRRLDVFLNRRHDWLEKPSERCAVQLLYGLLIPTIAMSLVIILQFSIIYGLSSLQSGALIQVLLHIGGYVLIINLVYFTRYLFFKLRETEKVLEREFPYYSHLD